MAMQGTITALRSLHFEDGNSSNNGRGPLVNDYANSPPDPTRHRPLHHALPHQMHQQYRQSQAIRQHLRHCPNPRYSPNGFSSPTSPPSSTSKKIKKFVCCSRAKELLQTTCALDGTLEIVILKGGPPSNELLYIQQHSQYQVRYNSEREVKQPVLLATIPIHFTSPFTFQSVTAFTQYIVNKKFIRFRNRGPVQTRHVSLWRIYQFQGEQSLFNFWIVAKAAQRALGVESGGNSKNYHLSAHQVSVHRSDSLGDDVWKHIFSFLSGPKFHCWVHIHEVVDRCVHRSNLVGLEFDANTRNVHVMRRSPALLKKVRAQGEEHWRHRGELKAAFFAKSVELFKAVY